MSLDTSKQHQYRVVPWDANITTSDVSAAIWREGYGLHTIQIIIDGTASVDIQLSLVESPAEGDDADWVKYGDSIAESSMVPINQLFRWIRVKRDATTDPVTVHILSGSRVNT